MQAGDGHRPPAAAQRHLHHPVVGIIWGREDRFLPTPFAEQLHALIPHSELHGIEGAGHTVQEDAPAQLPALLTREFRQDGAGA